MEYNRPKVGLGVIVVSDGKVLLGRRKNAHGGGTWSFPGGHLEKHETFEECAKREVMEEVGIEIDNVLPLAFTNDIFEEEDRHYVTLFFRADYVGGHVINMEPEKCDGWDWFGWDSLPNPLFLAIQNFLKLDINPTKSEATMN